MWKDFDRWNLVKKSIEESGKRQLFNEGDVWWCSVGINVAHEICGKGDKFNRPVLVIRKLSADTFVGVPLSTKEKAGSWYGRVTIKDRPQTLLLNQVRLFSTNRFESRMTTIGWDDLVLVKASLRQLLTL